MIDQGDNLAERTALLFGSLWNPGLTRPVLEKRIVLEHTLLDQQSEARALGTNLV